jgi:hypothetical protein
MAALSSERQVLWVPVSRPLSSAGDAWYLCTVRCIMHVQRLHRHSDGCRHVPDVAALPADVACQLGHPAWVSDECSSSVSC